MRARWLLGTLGTLTLAACSAGETDGVGSDQIIAGSCQPLQVVAEQAERCANPPDHPTPEAPHEWRHSLASPVIAYFGANHRGRDAFFVEGRQQWALGKFAYGANDKDLKDENVDVYVQVGCAGEWKKLGTAVTTGEDDQAVTFTVGRQDRRASIVADSSRSFDDEDHWVEGVKNTGGRVYFPIPEALPVGHHRIRMVVAGDGTFTDQYIEVLPADTSLFVSDVDGTLTERKPGDSELACDEESDFPAFLKGRQPGVHEHVAPTFERLAAMGYRPFYLTARPEWLTDHTREFLKEAKRQDGRGNLPRGIVHTTLTLTGGFNEKAEAFKKGELRRLQAKGLRPKFGFGNRPSDVAAYEENGIPYRYFYENEATMARDCSTVGNLPSAPTSSPLQQGTWRIESYQTVLDLLSQAPTPACKE